MRVDSLGGCILHMQVHPGASGRLLAHNPVWQVEGERYLDTKRPSPRTTSLVAFLWKPSCQGCNSHVPPSYPNLSCGTGT